jgi:hypothetical protein
MQADKSGSGLNYTPEFTWATRWPMIIGLTNIMSDVQNVASQEVINW